MTDSKGHIDCPLCARARAERIHTDKARSYYLCPVCALIFVPSEFHLSPAEEKARYDLHQNDPADPGYRDFLSRLVTRLVPYLAPGDKGLDFGSGPGPALSVILSEHGHRVENYDPYYAPDTTLLARAFDFVVTTETVEHLYRPAEGWRTIVGLVKPGGVLGVMTGIYASVESFAADGFAAWRYKDDPTHVAFYSEQTIRWIAAEHTFDVLEVEDGVAVLRRA